MTAYLSRICDDARNILKGLRVTFRTMLLPSVTVQYPTEKLVPYPRFRGMLLYDAEKCIACSMCIRACPSGCIALANASGPDGKRVPKIEWYTLDYGKCNFCGLCEEACPTKPKAVWHSLDYEAVFAGRNEMVRCWKRGDPPEGTVYDPVTKQFKPVTGQLRVQEAPARR